ncbi:MAG: DUF4365 domain-containing protein [Candidatus Daviesbacteria bacterium]|nr:DUF4365 domain-containing protein [Candidatus Daviesbacteria bacterium]
MSLYLKTKQLGNFGEAFVESVLSQYSIVHKIDGSKDVGLDMLCEWVNGESPTQTLFGIQVKTQRTPLKTKIATNGANFLQGYKKHIIIKPTTLNYWEGFDFPVFLFLVIVVKNKPKLIYYKRYTPILHKKTKEEEEPFYLAIKNAEFQAYVSGTKEWPKTGGFCRDLFFDSLRCLHNKGLLSGIDPNNLGLEGWNKDVLYEGVYDEYLDKIHSTLEKYKKFEKILTKK